MKTGCFLLIMLSLVLVSAAEVMATPVTPGGLSIQGRMQCAGDGYPLEWIEMVFLPLAEPHTGDPNDQMYFLGGDVGVIGVREGVNEIPIGSYESLTTIFLSQEVYAFDMAIASVQSGVWSDSQNLRVELRHPYSDVVYWSAIGPFSSESIHAYVELPAPDRGYEFRLTVVPDPPSFAVLLSGLGLLVYRRRSRMV